MQDALLDVDPLLAGARRRRLPPRHHQLLLPLAGTARTIRRCRPSERNASTAPAVNPYNFQDHLYDKSRPENLAFLKRFRALLDEYPATAAVGEVGDGQRGLEIVARLHRRRRQACTCATPSISSAPDSCPPARSAAVLETFGKRRRRRLVVLGVLQPRRGAPCHPLGQRRGADSTPICKLLSALLMSLRGSVCLYQGEELGLTEAELAFEDLQDPYGIRFWPEFKGRDGCRTPMVWESDVPNGGFSTGQALAAGARRAPRARRRPRRRATRHRCWRTIAASWPSAAPTRRWPRARSRFWTAEGECWPSRAQSGNERLVCVFNLGAAPAVLELPAQARCSAGGPRLHRRASRRTAQSGSARTAPGSGGSAEARRAFGREATWLI